MGFLHCNGDSKRSWVSCYKEQRFLVIPQEHALNLSKLTHYLLSPGSGHIELLNSNSRDLFAHLASPTSRESLMKKRDLLRTLAVGLCLGIWQHSPTLAQEPHPPVPLIFDTDIGNDVDDVLALGMIHALQSRHDCRLLAVTVTKDHPLAGSFVDCVNTFYGRDDVALESMRAQL